ncbi:MULTISPECIES: YaaL family protein [Bacillales]|uniref:YaaL family protein n=1 Tax=Bacillales TaxID=1385 RepID=UPI0018841218|nr:MULTISPECIES: YaaL family protein [Bacillaceae]MBF0709554.1 YaaL family protein [Pseudalkalibacillus hwajinpoensis]MDO6658690.1 YaaL family protein [Anaerobacillus sp. 1_MG-2023]
MFFKRKGYLRKDADERLIQTLYELKDVWNNQKEIVERSVEPSGAVLAKLKVDEAKYFFLLKEAKRRKIRMG